MTLCEAINIMMREIASVLGDNTPAVYLIGSVALDDFRFGWSDIDLLVLTEREITGSQADKLVKLRQSLSDRYPGNPYFRLFEGGMRSVDAFLNERNERTVYWGTSSQRIIDSYKLDSFGMKILLDKGKLLHGHDHRDKMTGPTYAQMRDDVKSHAQTARKHGLSVGWLLDMARCLYTLRTGKIISKTAAGEWALADHLCPDAAIMQKAIAIRKNPQSLSTEEKVVENAVVQRFADVIDAARDRTIDQFAKSEIQQMKIVYNDLSLIRNKDGVSVWRINLPEGSAVMKCFDRTEYRREMTNYRLLKSLNIPTLKVIACTDHALILEDIDCSRFRLGLAEDMQDPHVAEKIALWYRMLHQNGRANANTQALYDESDCVTRENIDAIKEKTSTADMQVWQTIDAHVETIQTVLRQLSRTLTYNDFHYTNLAVARDGSAVLLFDYNMLGKGYVYADIRNVCSQLGPSAKAAFLTAYGRFDEFEKDVDDAVSVIGGLHIACQREVFPNWGQELLDMVHNGRLLAAVERLLKGYSLIQQPESEMKPH